MPDILSQTEILRYSRHFKLPEVGVRGQEKIKRSRILIIGLGGLGSPAALYLAAAGVGGMGLVDFDAVDYSNIQRQIIHGEKDVDRAKLASAAEKVRSINSRMEISLHNTKLSAENALEIINQYDIIIDGTDNFPSRYLINDACVLSAKPYIYGSVYQFEGQVSVFAEPDGPCYRCLFPEPPPPGEVPSCAEGGVFGVLPGIIGILQATEALKMVLSIGEPLIGRLLYFDALKMSFREIKLKKNPRCAVCGENPAITKLIDYEEFCGSKENYGLTGRDDELSPEELHALLNRGKDFLLLDVREPHEFEICSIKNARLIPMGTIPERLTELNPEKETVVYCHHGIRSRMILEFLKKAGFGAVKNLTGGIDAWAKKIDPDMNKY